MWAGNEEVKVDSPQLAYYTESTARILKGTEQAEANGEWLTDILAQGTGCLFTCSGQGGNEM